MLRPSSRLELGLLVLFSLGLVLVRPGTATPVVVAQDGVVDEVHPRSAGSALSIEFLPYQCRHCVEEERLEGPATSPTMMRVPVEKLAETLELDDDWYAIESPHFKLLCSLEGEDVKFKEGTFVRADLERLRQIFPDLRMNPRGAKLNAHQRAHLYHIRAERQYAHFAALTACKKPLLGMPAKFELYVFQEYASHHAYVDRYVGGVQDKGGVQWHFREHPNFIISSVCADIAAQRSSKGDAGFCNHFMHNLAHNLVDGHNMYIRETWAWLEEGLAHYYERRENIRYNNFCWAEGSPPTTFVKPQWETTILSLVRRERDVPLPQWCEKLQPGELSGVENGMSWSIVKWMIETEPIRFTKMLDMVDDQKDEPTCSEAIEAAFGVSVSVLYQRWKDYVVENYGK